MGNVSKTDIANASYIYFNIKNGTKHDYSPNKYILRFDLSNSDGEIPSALTYNFSYVFYEKTPIYYRINTISEYNNGYKFNVEFEKFPKEEGQYLDKIVYNVVKSKKIPLLADEDYVDKNKDNGVSYLTYENTKKNKLRITQRYDYQITNTYCTDKFKQFDKDEYFPERLKTSEDNEEDKNKKNRKTRVKVEDRIRLVFEDEALNNIFYLQHISRKKYLPNVYTGKRKCPICGAKLSFTKKKGRVFTKCTGNHILSGDFKQKTISPIFVGGSRSGKTVFMTSLVNIGNDANIIDKSELLFIGKVADKDTASEDIRRIRRCDNNFKELDDADVFKENYYYSIGKSINNQTRRNFFDEIREHPLMIDCGKVNMVLYDIPGEISTTEGHNSFETQFNNGGYGNKMDSIVALFDFTNDVKRNIEGTEIETFFKVLKNIKSSIKNINKLPIAIVVNKVDYAFKSTSKFDNNINANKNPHKIIPNSNVGLFNIFKDRKDTNKILDYINEQSREIESYLKSLAPALTDLTYGLNVKYFATSSICSSDFEFDPKDNEKSIIIHPRRTIKKELPLLWIMHERGVM